MIRSMTAFSHREIKNNWGSATWEIRSVNHRYLETYFFLPGQFRSLEYIARKHIRSCLTRGKIECNLRFEPDICTKTELVFNEKLAKNLISAANWIKNQGGEGKINPVDILYWPGVMRAQDQDLNIIAKEMLTAFNETLEDFIVAREVEGKKIKELIEQRLKSIEIEVKKVRTYMPEILLWQRERIIAKLENAKVQFENNRLEQELVFIAQRVDISEELDRLEIHIKETYNTLNKKESIGRRLDFIMQELNREANTLASKSINTNVTNSAIELKVLIEQLREQIQNIE